MRSLSKVPQIIPGDPQHFPIRPLPLKMDFKTLRVDSHQSTIQCNVVVPAKYKAISRVVGSVFLIGHDVGRLQEFSDSQVTHGTSGSITTKNLEFEAMLAWP